MDQHQCLECGTQIRGRKDKKFCDDSCRNLFNNRKSANNNPWVRRIQNILRHNRKVLQELVDHQLVKSKVHRMRLYEMGFNFQYHTHVQKTPAGNTYFFCFEYGYAPLEQEYVLLVKKDKK
jgi:predicted nucleic acid-binding Zn ribbon protein